MKIAILTQPLHDNYGGLLQAYALKYILKDMGHEVIIINRKSISAPEWRKYASIAKSFLTGRNIAPNIILSKSIRKEISKYTTQFRYKYFPELSELITDEKGMFALNDMGFDAYVVGSDQCWRPIYSPSIKNYFLDFAQNDNNVKRISYAASFGVSEWEFSEEDTLACTQLIKKFDAVSVREDSAIDLLSKHLNRKDAIHVLDPTMLLSIEKYKQLVQKENVEVSQGNLKVYVLDRTPKKMSIVDKVSKKLGLTPFEIMPKRDMQMHKVTKQNIGDFVFPNPASWIRGFMDAEFVIADSFHGCVFSILFNVPFIAIGNEGRGLSRFSSLLKVFSLEDRLVTDLNSFNTDDYVNNEINWDSVNIKLSKEKEKALSFLKESLQ